MDVMVPLPVALPLLAAAVLTAVGHFLPPWVDDVLALAATAAALVLSLLLVVRSDDHDLVYWFGGWKPRDGVALGISFTVDPAGAAIAALAAALMLAALVFSWRYFDEVGRLFAVLMLVFLAGMTGFALSGDLFNMFVWFELMSVAAYALTGYRVERPSPLQGAINFAVTNSVGSFCILFGTGFLYARTGALNLDQIGDALAGHRADGLVVVAFALLAAGFLTKAGAVPFHFWLADAYAVAPLPICVVFAGVMSDLGPYAVGRIYWLCFSGAIDAGDIRPVLVGVGILTAIVGGVMCFLQRDLKRLLAFATISNIGVVLVAVGLLTAHGLAATAVYLNTNGVLRGALFLAVGMLVRWLGTGDELELRARMRGLPFARIVFVAAAVAIALLPPFGPFLATSLLIDSANQLGYAWVVPLVVLATVLSAGTILRAAARIFGGLGAADDPLLTHEPAERQEEPEGGGRVSPVVMWAPAVALLACGLALAFVPNVAGHTIRDAARILDRPAHAREVLRGVQAPPRDVMSYSPSSTAYVWGAIATLGAIGFATVGLYRQRLPAFTRRLLSPAARGLQALHSGAIGDYVTWFVVGAAVLGGLFAALAR